MTATAEMTPGAEMTATREPTLADVGSMGILLPNIGGSNAITLTDGIYTSAITESTAVTGADSTSLTVQLLPEMAMGDLNDDGMNDAAAAVIVGGSRRNGLYLLALTAQADGSLQQAGAALIGSGQIVAGLAITNAQIVVDLEQMATADSTCCATAAEQRTYALRNDRLMLAEARPIHLPYLPRTAEAIAPEPFPMSRGAISGTVEGELEAGGVASYVLQSRQAQTATITLEVESGGAALAVSRQGLPSALLTARAGAVTWTGTLPVQGALVLDVVSLQEVGAPLPYTLGVALEADSGE